VSQVEKHQRWGGRRAIKKNRKDFLMKGEEEAFCIIPGENSKWSWKGGRNLLGPA
jgi:hypothetical protein